MQLTKQTDLTFTYKQFLLQCSFAVAHPSRGAVWWGKLVIIQNRRTDEISLTKPLISYTEKKGIKYCLVPRAVNNIDYFHYWLICLIFLVTNRSFNVTNNKKNSNFLEPKLTSSNCLFCPTHSQRLKDIQRHKPGKISKSSHLRPWNRWVFDVFSYGSSVALQGLQYQFVGRSTAGCNMSTHIEWIEMKYCTEIRGLQRM